MAALQLVNFDEPVFHWDIKQGTKEWETIKIGKISSSTAPSLFTSPRDKTQPFGATAMNKAMEIAMERMTGIATPLKSFYSGPTNRGNTLEPKARDNYELSRFVKVREIGFIDRGKFGTSPDAVVMPNGLVEIKSYSDSAKFMKAALGKNKDHDLQIKWHLFVSKFEWCDYVAFYPESEKSSAINRYYNDELQNRLFEEALIRYEAVIEEFIYKFNNSEVVN